MRIKHLFYSLLALPLMFVACEENAPVDDLIINKKAASSRDTEKELTAIMDMYVALLIFYIGIIHSEAMLSDSILPRLVASVKIAFHIYHLRKGDYITND